MRIGIDYISAVGGGGNSIYTKGLIEALAQIDYQNQYYLYSYIHDFLLGRKKVKTNNNFKERPIYSSRLKFPIPRKIIKSVNKIFLRAAVSLDGIDVFHFANPLNFIEGIKGSVVTIHDLSVFHNSQWAKQSSVVYYKENIENILNKADKIIAVPNFTKEDIVRFFKIDDKKIKVIYEGAKDIFRPSLAKDYLKDKFGLENYILYLGELQPRKNIIRLLKAYHLLDSDLRRKYNLVLVGKSRSKEFLKKMNQIISQLKIGDFVKQLGYLEEKDLPAIYNGAKFFIFPSLCEGFGLPVLESISCATPVISSAVSSLPEIVGQAGLLIDPEDINQIKSAMEKLLLNQELYQSLKDNCLVQAKKFSWPKAAQETLALYQEVYERK